MRRAFVVAAAAAVVFVLGAGVAVAREFSLPAAHVEARVLPDGSIRVTEHITYSFTGRFRGGFREIPLRDGELLVDPAVSEDGVSYRPGAPADIGSEGEPGTFGTTAVDGGVRILWHYAAADETRSFTVAYTLTGVAEAWDDVVDVYLQLWGDEWDVELGRLTGDVTLPRPAPGTVRVWGHAAGVDGGTELREDGRGASVLAENVPPGQFVEVRLVFPRALLTSTAGAEVRSGTALDRILAEEAALAAGEAAARRRARWIRSNVAWLVPLTAVFAFAPAGLVALWVY
ncbi:MAG TPA: DUF2207 domain-containing protein, partial [Actinomycetota bacterium]|nr:DUF2207 domain-containing protein [Actinomycetota bacterium]